MSSLKFKLSDEIKKKGSYKSHIKAKLSTHLLLTEDNKVRLKDLLDSGALGVVEMEWDLFNKDQVMNRDQFLQQNNLDIDPDDVWFASGSRVSTARYPYVVCLAFVTISLCNNEICGIGGYLNHSKQCVISQLQHDPTYRLLPYMKKSVKNLLSLNVRTSDILAQNARTVKNVFRNHTLIGNSRTLLTAMDITNIKKQMLKTN
ncbi:6563_t:CDS:2 [Gigaspora rosea]|nr:6563_t:CDS:2 [Gigaspora rosea]